MCFACIRGLRIGELLALEWSDIDFNKGTITVNKTCHDGRDYADITELNAEIIRTFIEKIIDYEAKINLRSKNSKN
ncbi:MAG: tyrosine-type recombinase/integrase [Bacillales bacterium]|nr:tyrosine-type recombinase/integrase [Bacillales bacterium]